MKEPVMKRKKLVVFVSGLLLAVAFDLSGRPPVFAHCDGLDGPVVKAAHQALETGNVNLVLIWVQKHDERAVTDAFQKTSAVRKLSREAKELADMYFFETLVRIHRAGEGEPYTGLKPAGRDLGPAIPSADAAIDTANVEPISKVLNTTMQKELGERFSKVITGKKYRPDDVEAGRAYVASYVSFLTYVESIYEAVTGHAESHAPDLREQAHHQHTSAYD
jgi:hypothetical protein